MQPRALALLVSLAAAAAQAQVVPPSVRCPGAPAYPEAERGSRRDGTVLLRVSLSPSGELASVAVVTPLSPAFDAAAEQALRKCSFTGASRDGVPVAAQLEMGIAFVAPPLPARLEGVVVGERGQPVSGATVSTERGSAITDDRGAFFLPLELASEETVVVTVLKPPVAAQIFEELLQPGETRQVRYALVDRSLSATVRGERLLPRVPDPDRTPTVGKFVLGRADIDRTPGSMEDITRAIATLPGVVADPDLLATFTVRGGAAEETIDYLDGVPLSNPFHLGGFASIYNPMLITSAEFYAGATPPRYRSSLSGALDVAYATGETKRLHIEADLSMQTAKIRAQLPTGVPGLSVTAAFRRSFFEVYFGALRAVHLLSADYVAPEIGEYFGRAFWDLGAHRLTLTYVRATDGFSFLLKPGEKPLFGTTGGLELSNLLQLGILTDRVAIGAAELTLTAAVTHDASNTTIASQTLVARNVSQLEALGRADLSLPIGSGRLAGGLQLSHRSYAFRGQVSDARGVAPWAAFPLVETAQGNVDITTNAPANEPAAYAEFLLRPAPALAVELGGRLELPSPSRSPVYSARTAVAYDLPAHGILKAEAGLATQLPANVLWREPGYGNPDLLPERSRQLAVALEQPLPFEALLRIEAFSKWLDRLAVNPDSRASVRTDSPVFQSSGTGTARGVDLLVAGRKGGLSYGVSAGLLFADRTNPLASGRSTYPTAWDQRFSAGASFSYAPADLWLLSARAQFHTGRPYTPVERFVRDDAGQRYLPVFGETDSARYPSFFEASARVERRFSFSGLSMAWYAEVLNFTNASNVFALTYDSGDYANRVEPEPGAFNHLPIRPFLGVRGEY